jgi:hypothetical protein
MAKHKLLSVSIILAITLALASPSLTVSARPRAQATEPGLGTVGSYSVLGASTVTNTGPTYLGGDLGVSPGSAITGFPPGTLAGTIHAADASALQAQSDATAAYNDLNNQPCNSDLTGQDLGGLLLPPGTYCFDSSSQLTGNLVLDAQGDPNAVWIFRMGSTLTTASFSSVTYINSSQPLCNVYWQVGSSATLGTGTQLIGNIFAVASITMTTGANLDGRAVARTGAVTLDTNTIIPVFCAMAPTVTLTIPNTATATIIPASPTRTPTATPVNTNTPTVTLAPGVPTSTPTATPVNTSTPTVTATPGGPTSTPTATPADTRTRTVTLTSGGPARTPTASLLISTFLARIIGLPNSGGTSIRNTDLPWLPVILGAFGLFVLALGFTAFRRTRRSKQQRRCWTDNEDS